MDEFLGMVDDSSTHEELRAMFNIDYAQNFQRNIFADYSLDSVLTLQNVRVLLEGGKKQIQIGARWYQAFEHEIAHNLGKTEGSSGRIIARIGVANGGLRNSIMKTQATLDCVGVTFKLPLLLSSRPWEGDRKMSPYMSLDSKEFKMLEFGLDERQNAQADIDRFKVAAKRGAPATIKLRGAAGNMVSKKSFRAELN